MHITAQSSSTPLFLWPRDCLNEAALASLRSASLNLRYVCTYTSLPRSARPSVRALSHALKEGHARVAPTQIRLDQRRGLIAAHLLFAARFVRRINLRIRRLRYLQ